MKRVRVIPIMLLDEGRAVITRQFQKPIYIGDPINAIKIFNDKEVDEMVILDISSKKIPRIPNYNLIAKLASESFMPLAYGGNISTTAEAEIVINSGVEKICINTGLFRHAETVREIVRRYGSQSVVASIDVSRNILGKYRIKTENGRSSVPLSVKDCANHLIELGVGEIILNSIAKDGMMTGYDYDLIAEFKPHVNMPIVAAGGGASLEDFKKAIQSGASAVAGGAVFYFKGSYNSILINYPDQKTLKENLYSVI